MSIIISPLLKIRIIIGTLKRSFEINYTSDLSLYLKTLCRVLLSSFDNSGDWVTEILGPGAIIFCVVTASQSVSNLGHLARQYKNKVS